jgi:hypothetical protein
MTLSLEFQIIFYSVTRSVGEQFELIEFYRREPRKQSRLLRVIGILQKKTKRTKNLPYALSSGGRVISRSR